VKGRFSNTEEGFYGLFCFIWHADSSSPSGMKQIVVGDSDVQEISPSESLKSFQSRIESFRAEEGSMGGYTDELQHTLKSDLSDRGSDLYQTLEDQDLDILEDVLSGLLRTELEMDSLALTVEAEVQRRVTEESSRSRSTRSSDTKVEENPLKGNVEINPVRGVPITKISPGERIFVRLTESGSSGVGSTGGVKEYENNDGLIPAQLISKEANAAGKLRLKVEFPNGVPGTLTCGKDVSIVVPEGTKDRLDDDSSGELPGFLQDEIFLGTTIAIIILIVIGIWLFL
jgi:hypothetical protein